MAKRGLTDYRGESITEYNLPWYHECSSCGKLVLYYVEFMGMCPKCWARVPQFNVQISFGYSRSSKYPKVVKRVQTLANYSHIEIDDRHILTFNSLNDIITQFSDLYDVFNCVSKWASFGASICGYECPKLSVGSLGSLLSEIKYLSRLGIIKAKDLNAR